ncbi:MAG: FG-GAP-like repeat-containing protein, partial [Phycisphaerales bacterium]|nr:FG-GAP-like repeat-containing protein [Phycisphaerales bacterium]
MLNNTTLQSAAFLSTLALSSAALADDLTVLSVSPPINGLNAPIDTPIVINFDRPVAPATFTPDNFHAFGRWSGSAAPASFIFSNNDQTVTLTPGAPFSAGEPVMVVLSHDLLAADGSPLRPAGYSFRFWTRTRPACFIFQELDVMSNRTTPSEQTRIYGALGCDLDNDGWLDIVTVNEVSADLRIFMNAADGSGTFDPFLQPPEPGLFEMSPNEPGDFNGDGFSDVCVASTATDNVLVFLGEGDGTFQPAQIIEVGNAPLGIAVLDFDGDGDLDIVNGNNGSNNLSRMINNGAGVFGSPTFFDGGVNGEYGIAAADMNNDGILDLAVGGSAGQQVRVMRGNGDATFTPLGLQNSGGLVWQLGTGDVNGDGNEDVHTSNSFSNSGSILLGNGAGGLAAPQVEPVGGHAPATDLGDFDGDGDLDWLLSSFGAGI